MSDSVTPEDLEQQNLRYVNANNSSSGTAENYEEARMEDAHMEDGRMAATSRFTGIDMGRAIIMDREVSNNETIIRVKLDDEINPYNEVHRRVSSPHVIADTHRPSYTARSLERHNSSPSNLEATRASIVNGDPSRIVYVNVDPPSSNIDPSAMRTSYLGGGGGGGTNPHVIKDDQQHPGGGGRDCAPCRRVSSPAEGQATATGAAAGGNPRRNSSPGVDSARPSLSVFRFKQTAANNNNNNNTSSAAHPSNNLPPRSPSPGVGRRVSTGEVSSTLLKPTYNSARRSTYHVNFSAAERRRSSSPTQNHPPADRRTSTSDVPSSGDSPSSAYYSRRRTTTGDIHAGKRPGSPVRGRESKRFSRIRQVGPLGAVVLSWTNLTVKSREGKILLDNLSGQVHTGFTAIMGPSGSGKSTLLNTLGCRMDKSAMVSGQIRLNGLEYTNAELKRMAGYVMQDDLLNPHLTVDETLWYTVKLKLEPFFTEADLAERVNTVVAQMGLEHCRGTVIGSPLRKGISGGERKRVAVGMELLTSPQLLLLDEPTSGLDSMTALSICTLLREIADERYCTVVCTIHQPQSKIFNLFQFLIILKAGKLIYQGSAPGVLKFFEESGFPCPELTNPADHLLDVISHTDKYHSTEEKLRSHFVASPVNLDEGADRPLQLNRERMPWHRQFLVLLNRGYKEQYRKKNVVITQLIQSIVTALLIGGVFFQIGHHQKSTTRRQPVLFFCVINQGVFGALTVINSFPSERVLILRERAAGMYFSSAYYMAKITAETTCQVISPIMFSMIVYWMVGFQHVARKFFLFMFFMILCQLSATSLALMTSALCRTTDLSVTVLPMLLEVNRLFGGFFLPPISLPKYFSWLDALSYVKYCYVAISQSELHGLRLSCLPHELKNGVCPITSGKQTIESLGLDYITIGDCAGILIVYIIVTRFVGYLGIRYIKH